MNCRSKSSPTARQKQTKNVCWHFIWDYDEYIHYLVENHLSYPFLSLSCFIAIAKSLQSCPTLCNPIDGSPPGFPVPGILQARTPEWVAISFSNAWKWSRSVVSDSQRPYGLQPYRLLHPWDFPGKSTGVGCHYIKGKFYILFWDFFFSLKYYMINIFPCCCCFFIFLTPVWLLHYWVCQTNLDFRLGLVLGFHLFIEVYLVC